jgi:protein O-GlcNAc transferase
VRFCCCDSQIPRPENVTVIAIMCEEYGQTWWPHWGPWTAGKGSRMCFLPPFQSSVRFICHALTGLGGSEEAVVHTVRSLHKQFGHRIHIEVYADPEQHNIGFRDGAAWYPGAFMKSMVH